MLVLESQVVEQTNPDGVLFNEESLGAGIPVGAGADESAALGLLEPGPYQFASLRFPQFTTVAIDDFPSFTQRVRIEINV